MKLNENEEKRARTTMLVYGYKEYETSFFDSEEYDSLRSCMLNNLPTCNDERIKFKLCCKSDVLRDGRYVIDKHMGNIDLRIPYTDGDDLESQLVVRFGNKPKREQYDEIIDYVKNHINLIRVTDIPLYLNMSQGQNGNTATTWFYGFEKMDEYFYEKIPVCTKEIGLAGICDDNSKCIYVHEMCHALLNRHKGSVRNFLSNEALPIFMEKVAALDLDGEENLLDLKILSRLLHVKCSILDKEILEYKEEKLLGIMRDRAYIISSLLASALFDTYYKGSNKLRGEIDDSINEVLMGNGTIEDVLDKYEASLDKGSRVVQRQIKKYSK